MFCNECGNQIPIGADFCPVCGNKMRMVMPESKTPSAPVYQMDAGVAAMAERKPAAILAQPVPVSAHPVQSVPVQPMPEHPVQSIPVQPISAQSIAMLNCLEGTHKGKTFPLQGEIIIGSLQGQVHIVLEDTYVSRKHLSIRFNTGSGCYEVRDQSMNGTFMENGTRLPKGAYASCPRGAVIYLGSPSQKFKLM